MSGVRFRFLLREDDGTLLPDPSRTGKPEPVSGGEGRFVLELPAKREVLMAVVSHPRWALGRVEGGIVHESGKEASVVFVPVALGEPLRLIYRDEERRSWIRVRNGTTGEVLRDLAGAFVQVRSVTTGGLHSFSSFTPKPDPDGWFRSREFRGADLVEHRSGLDIAVPGFERRRVHPGELGERTEVDLVPWTARVLGTVVLPEGEVDRISSLLVAPKRNDLSLLEFRPRGLPGKEGPFEIQDIPEGRWTLHVHAVVDGEPWSARRPFEWLGGVVDLGEIRLRGPGRLRARALGADGLPLLDAHLVAFSPFEGTVLLSGRGWAEPKQQEGVPVDPDERVPRPDGGWREFGPVTAGATYAVRDPDRPGLEGTVAIPETPGATATLELRWTGRMVRCTLRFTVDGEPFERVLGVPYGPTPLRDWDWAAGEVFEGMLAEGRHDIQVKGVKRGTHAGNSCRGVLEIPPQDRFEATVDTRWPTPVVVR